MRFEVAATRWLAGAAGLGVAWAVAAASLRDGLPAGIVLRGVVDGCSIALLSAGVVLVFRTTRVLNLATGAIGVAGAVLTIELRTAWNVPYVVAVAAGVAAAAATGAVVDGLVVRRLRRAPAVVATVATLGVGQLVAGGAFLLDDAIGAPDGRMFGPPIDVHLDIHPMRFDGSALVALATAVAVGLLAIRLHRGDVGLALRATGDDPERAALAGVGTARWTATAWAIAGGLAALAVIMLVPLGGPVGTAVVVTTGPALLLRVLAAAAIAGFDRIPQAVAAAVVLGVVEESVAWTTPNTTIIDALLVVVVIGAVAVRRPTATRAASSIGEWFGTHRSGWRTGAIGWRPAALAVGVALTAPLVLDAGQVELAGVVVIQAILAISVVVLAGWSGHLVIGQFAVAGIGGAVTALLFGRYGWDLMLALPVGVTAAAAVSVVLALPALRAGPLASMVVSGAFAVAAWTFLLEDRYVSWLVETSIERPVLWERLRIDTPTRMYVVCLAGLALTMVVATNLGRTRFARVLVAVRDNPRAAAAVGVVPWRATLMAHAASGAIAGVAGSLFVVHQRGVDAASFTPEVSVQVLAVAVVGGLGSIPGAVAAAVMLGTADLVLAQGWSFVASGVGMLAILLLVPGGLGGLAARRGPSRPETADEAVSVEVAS